MAKQKSSSTTRQAILQAANRVVIDSGVAALTLDAVAHEAGVSKGGLLYHFPSKEKLVEGLLEQLLEGFTAEIEREAGVASDEPGRWLRGYVRTSFDPDRQALDISAGLLAAVVNNPDLLAPMRQQYDEWQRQIEQDGIDPAVATLVRLAADGLWFAELFGFAPPTEPLRTRVETLLLTLIKEARS
jgi:AcrR family transcriptional regulator